MATADLIIVQKSWVVIKSLLALALLLVITVRVCGTYSFSELTTERRVYWLAGGHIAYVIGHANREAEKIIKMMEWLYWILLFLFNCSSRVTRGFVASPPFVRAKKKWLETKEAIKYRSIHNDSHFFAGANANQIISLHTRTSLRAIVAFSFVLNALPESNKHQKKSRDCLWGNCTHSEFR